MLEFAGQAVVAPPDAGPPGPAFDGGVPPIDAGAPGDAAPLACVTDLDCAEGRCVRGACFEIPALCAEAEVAEMLGDYEGTTMGVGVYAPSCGQDGAPEAIYLFTVAEPTNIEFTTRGSDFDTVLAVLEGCVAEVACNDDIGLRVTSRVRMLAEPGRLYAVVVDGYDEFESGDFVLTVRRR